MIIARGHVRRVRDHGRSVVGLDHAQRRQRVEPLGERAREPGRHMLHHEHRRRPAGRQARDHFRERARPAGRRRQGDREARPGPQRLLGWAPHGRGRAGHDRDVRHVGGEGPAHGAAQLGCHALQRGPVRIGRLGDDLDRPELQGADRRAGAGPRVRAHHDNRAGRLRHDVADGAQPVELRHLEVHRDDVGVELMHLAHRVEAVARRAHDPKLPRPRDAVTRAEHVAQHASHQRAVVHDEDAGAAVR